ncbi:PLP-dependent aminotransferase family protein [Ochrobactrum sp. BTU1]|nr:PLP-dependent aminotransferase family protein [Ochrobactrum sp. BTU1]
MFKHAQLETVKAWIALPANAAMPLHARIQRAIRQLIIDGALSSGRPLPASRMLAKSLQVSRDTVEAAYTQLHAEGFIDRRVGSGSFVAEMSELLSHQCSQNRVVPTRNPGKLSRRGNVMARNGGVREASFPRPFSPGVPETRAFPLALWERLERQVRKEYGVQTLTHGDPQGSERLRKAVADYVNLERGARATAEQVLILTSSQQALSLCANVLFDPGDRIFIEDPAYHGARKAFEAAGLECMPVRVDENGLVVEEMLGSDVQTKAVFLTPSHQFPTGATLSLERRLSIIEWARKNQTWVIEDDYDSEFHYAGKPTACVQGLDAGEQTIYIGTFTKSLFPGLRIGYVVLPPALVQPMTSARTLFDGHSALTSQLTLARFMEGGHFGAYVRTMRILYAKRLSILTDLISKHLSEYLTTNVPTGGLQLACTLTGRLSEASLIEAGRRAGIDLLGLSHLYMCDRPPAGILMGFAAYTPGELEAAVKKLAISIEDLTVNRIQGLK